MKLYAKVFFLVILWIITFTGILQAQKISLKDVQLDLSLQDYRLEDIIDGTPDDDIIGYAYKGIVNSSLRQVYFDDSVTEEFEYLFKPAFSKSDDAIPLVIRINNIQVNEWSEVYYKKVCLTSLSLSIFQQVEENKYVLIADRFINNYTSKNSKVNNLSTTIGQAVHRAFDYLDLYIDINRPGLTWTELWEYEPFNGIPYPRLDQELKLYEHYSDFRMNQPLESSTASLTKNSTESILLDEENQHPIDIWGYTNEGVLFINVGQRFIPVDRIGKGFKASLNPNNESVSTRLSSSFLEIHKIKSLLSSSKQNNNFEVPLNDQTGFLDFKAIYDSGEIKDRIALGERPIIEFAPFGHQEDVLDIKIDDLLITQLSKGEFFEIPLSFRAKELQACVSGRCETISINEVPLHRVIFKKGIISQEPFTEKEKMRYLRNVDLKYWVLF